MNHLYLPQNDVEELVVASPKAIRQSQWKLRLETEVWIASSAEQVWETITDFPRYLEWNPAIPSAEGDANVGSILKVQIKWPGLACNHYRLSVTEADCGQALSWLGRFGMRGMMDGEHSFLIKSLPYGGVLVKQVENFSGFLIPFFAPWLQDNVLRGFVEVNNALKSRLEDTQGILA